jgi:hypothetical protein
VSIFSILQNPIEDPQDSVFLVRVRVRLRVRVRARARARARAS